MDDKATSEAIASIKNVINSKGLKQNFIAQQMGINPSALSDMLHGRIKIKMKDILVLSKLLDVTPNELLGYQSEKEIS